MSRPGLSVAIITFNEEKNIRRCLESVLPVADEVLIVDSFSTDNTEAICRSYEKVLFLKNSFEGYVNQKNFALQKAENSFVLCLDADEELSAGLQQNILKLKDNFMYNAYSFNRLNNYCGTWIRHSGWYPDRKVRLVNRELCSWGGVDPHDKMLVPNDEKAGFIKGDLLHYTYHTLEEHMEGLNRFTSIAAMEAHKKGKKAGIWSVTVYPFFVFIKKYFLQLGILDGYAGFLVSVSSAWYRYLKYAKLRQMQNNPGNHD